MWLKIKVWTKIVLFGLLALYVLIFLIMNMGQETHFWYWYNRNPSLPTILVVAIAFVLGIVGTILVRTTFTTLGQLKHLQSRARAERLEREVSDMKTKAAMLRTRESLATADTMSEGSEPK